MAMDIALKTDHPDEAGGHRVFAYGTLCVREIMERIVGRPHALLPAVLQGYSRRSLKDRAYPALVHDPSTSTRGMLYLGLSDEELRKLDDYEGREYDRELVEAETRHGPTSCFVYVLSPRHAKLALQEIWDLGKFLDDHVSQYLRHL